MGKKWASIARAMNGNRTEHSIKNRFNSLVKPFFDKEEDPEEKKIVSKILNRLRKAIYINKRK